MVGRFVHFEVLCTAKYRYGEKFKMKNAKYPKMHEAANHTLFKF
jgi:hypothetical protein